VSGTGRRMGGGVRELYMSCRPRICRKEGVTGDKLKWSFAFKCHRTGLNAFPVNSVDTHPHPDFQVRAGGQVEGGLGGSSA